MSIATVTTRGYGNGTLSGTPSLVTLRGYADASAIVGGRFFAGEVYYLGFKEGEDYYLGFKEGERTFSGFREGEQK